MIKKLFAFTVLLFLIGCVGGTSDSDAQVDPNESNLSYISTGPSTVYLPLVTKNYPWVSSFGVHISYVDNVSLGYAQESNNEWMHGVVLLWSKYQPNSPNEFILDENVESQLRQLKEAGQKVIIVIIGTPDWAQKYPDSHCGPMGENYLDDFANFVNQVVARYSQPEFNVFHYEIWNEPEVHYSSSVYLFGCWGDPNLPYFGGGYYAEMLKVVYPAIKAANSEAQLILGGLLLDCDPRFGYGDDKPCKSETSMKMSTFFEGILANGGGDYLDFVNFHAYNYHWQNTSPIQQEFTITNWAPKGGQIEGKLDYLHEMMQKYKVDKPIVITELALLNTVGTETDDYEEDKAEYVVWSYTRNWAKNIDVTIWYHLDKGGWRGSGLLDEDNNPTPAYEAYKVLTSTLQYSEFTREFVPQEGIKGFEFNRGYKIWVLLSLDGDKHTLDLPAGAMRAFDMYGKPIDISSGTITITRPVYIEFR